MKRITMTLMGLVFAFSANAQDLAMKSNSKVPVFESQKAVLYEALPGPNGNGIVSVYSNAPDDLGVYTADDFNLAEDSDITSVTAFGFNNGANFVADFTGLDVYIYDNSTSNTPAGDPTLPGSGVLEIVNLDAADPAITVVGSGEEITVDIVAALGSPVTLSAGDYWITFAPRMNIPGFDGTLRWNHFASGEDVTGVGEPHLIDPGNAFGGGFLDWTPLSGLGITDQGGLAFRIEGEPAAEFPLPYCGPLDFTSSVEPISNVEFAGIANTSDPAVGATPAHEDFTSISGEVLAGESYDIVLEGNTDGDFTNRFAVFIDWNQNEVLDDAGEVYEITTTLVNSNGADGQQVIQTLDVPVDALEGETRMRVKKLFGTTNYLDPCLGTGFGQAEDYSINVSIPSARVQVVHNAPDPAAEVVDVYLNGDLLLDDFEFRTASPFVDAPANTPITIDIAPGTSTDVSESIFSVSPTLVDGETYIVVADGVLDPSLFDDSVNAIAFNLEVFAGAREAAASAGNTDVLVHHGSPDAPTVDVVNQGNGGVLVDDISYPEFQGYLELPTGNYVLDVTTADNSAVVESYLALLATFGLEDAAVTVFASGFLDPAANQNGPAFGLWVSLASGGPLVELPTQDTDPGFPGFYCGPLDFTIDVEPISNVEFSDMTNPTDPAVNASPAHEDFTGITVNVNAGESYEIVLEGNTAGNFTNRFAVFIDWNQDFLFDGPNEVYEITQTITNSNGADGQQAVQVLDVPADAPDGETRMRVKKIFGTTGYLDPCAGASFGQAEDYTVSVGTLSSDNFENTIDFSFYPNPVKDILSISTQSSVESLKVYNMLGQLVKETSPNSANPQISLSEFNSGVYLVSMEVEGRVETFRVMKQ
ncbi:GEVED domain-containing protein [Psychroflexus tropicus]|uniref:GEVED domain-containing protein n=1 Tax=Psychroflexus tropicus TaxID=197345 RepID=UPI0003813360|nr:GEVED domain-containing protein [Psychroflexus tropicus]